MPEVTPTRSFCHCYKILSPLRHKTVMPDMACFLLTLTLSFNAQQNIVAPFLHGFDILGSF